MTHRTSLEGSEKACDRGINLHLPPVPADPAFFGCSPQYFSRHLHPPPRFSLSPMLSSQTPDKHKMGWQPDGEWSPRGAGDLILPRLTPGDPDLRWALRVALIWSPGNKCGAVCTGAEKALSTQRMAGAVQEPTFLPPPVTCHFFSFSQVSTVDPESTDLLDRAHSLAL